MTLRIIGGTLRQRPLKSPKGQQTRPSSSRLRETLFNICQHKIVGATFLDLFAGSGAVGIEALSRGAASATFVDRETQALIKQNLKALDLPPQTVVKELRMVHQSFDIIFADPPYAEGELIEALLETLTLLKPDGWLFIEDAQPHCEHARFTLEDSRRIGKAYLHRFTQKGA